MRFREILTEALARYRPMFNGFTELRRGDIDDAIRWAEDNLKKQDRIIWYLRWWRLWYAYRVHESMYNPVTGDLDPDYQERAVPEKAMNKMWHAVGEDPGPWSVRIERAGEIAKVLQSRWKHYVDMTEVLPAMGNIVWDRQSPEELTREMDNVEAEWQSRLDHAVQTKEGDEEIIDFHNGWAWWLLDRGYCRDEAEAMGHCGNQGAAGGDRIVSLRKHIEENYWEPHLTFILDYDGELGEMKGRGNNQPTAKYHDMIVALLRSDYVKGIKGGGYMPENNFALSHLGKDVRDKLKQDKPELREPYEIYLDWHNEKEAVGLANISPNVKWAFDKILKHQLNQRGGYRSIDYAKEEVVISKSSVEAFATEDPITNAAVNLFSELPQIIAATAFNMQDMNAEALADRAEAENKDTLLSTVVGASKNYRCSIWCVYDSASESVLEKISFSDVFDTDETLDGVERWDETYDHDSDSDFDWLDVPNSAIGQAMLLYCIDEVRSDNPRTGRMSQLRSDAVELVQTILGEYGLGGRGGWGSPTSKDPRQLQFDLPNFKKH
jgi:hypothetical protein